mgnify:CR=1 FL=1
MHNDFDFFQYYFIETEDELYYISDIPNMIYTHSLGDYLFKHEEILLIDRTEKENDEYVKAYRIATEKIISWGRGQTIESFTQDELETIRKNRVFRNKTLYTMI